jgi:4-amino-4-deoxy-L-arabinose transferase-like glycosyltransferase
MTDAAPKPATWGGLTLWRWAVLFSAVALIYRLWFSTHFDLVGDEAYYWLLSHRLDLSYFDKGPGVAWTIAASRLMFGDTVFGVRFFAALLSVATGWWMFLLARRLYDERIALGALVLTCIIPLFAVGAILMTIDPLSVFFWTTAAYAFWVAQETEEVWPWVLTGALVGLGALCKYINLFQLLCFIIFLAIDAGRRKRLLSGRFAAMIAVALLMCLPMIVWNAQHGWVAIRHLAERGAIDKSWHVSFGEPLTFLGLQALVISPIFFVGVVIAAFTRGGETGSRAVATRYLQTLFVPLFLMYFGLSINKAGQPNWTAPAYVAGVILLSARFLPAALKPGTLRKMAMAGVAIAAAATFLLHGYTKWFNRPPGRDVLDRARGSADLAAKVDAAKARTDATYVIANKYSTASLMMFYMAGHPRVYQPDTTPRIDNQFSIWPGYETEPAGSSALFLTDFDYVPAPLKRDFEQVEFLADLDAVGDGRTVGKYHLYLARGRIDRSSR